MENKMNIKKQIHRLQQQINLRELANDSYYLSQQYKEDQHAMYELKKLLSQQQNTSERNWG